MPRAAAGSRDGAFSLALSRRLTHAHRGRLACPHKRGSASRRENVVALLRTRERGQRLVRPAELGHRLVPNRLTRQMVSGAGGFFIGKFSSDGDKFFCTGNDRRLRCGVAPRAAPTAVRVGRR